MVSALFLTPPIRKVADPIVRERNVSPSPIRIPWLTLRCRAWLCSVILLVGITQVKGHGTPTTSPHTSTHHCTRAEDDSALLRPSTPFCALLRPSAPFSPFRAAPPYRCLPNPFFASPLLFPTAPLNLLPVPVYSSCGPHRWRRRCGGLVTKAASSSPSTPAYRARILSTSPHRHATRLHFAPSSCMPAHAPSRRVHAIARHGHTLSNRN